MERDSFSSPVPAPSFSARRAFVWLFPAAAALLLLLAAAEQLPPTWDEGDTAARADSVLAWARGALSPCRAGRSDWSGGALRRAFPNTVSREGHPAGYVILTAAGKAFSTRLHLAGRNGLFSEKCAYRFGAVFLWTCALGAVFCRVRREFSGSAALFALLAVLSLPRVFTHALIAFGDSPLISGALLTWAFFPRDGRRPLPWLVWGLFLGLTAAMKFTGALFLLPSPLWLLLRRERRSRFPLLALGAAAALLAFWLLNPPLWHHPVSGLAKYIELNTHRQAYNIGILFLGRFHSLDAPLPWWNPFFWTAVTVPAGLLVSAAALVAAAARARRRRAESESGWFAGRRLGEISLLVLVWLPLIAVRTIPGLPVHDGTRLFIAAFPFLAILAGLGLARLWAFRRFLPRAAALLILLGSGSSSVLYFPQGLSYYNLFIGGLPGAARAGMEVTYYWDGLDREVSAFLNRGAAAETARPVLFGSASPATLARWREWTGFPGPAETVTSLAGRPGAEKHLAETPFRYYVMQNRASGLTPFDRNLLKTQKPVWYKTAGMWRTPKMLKGTPWDLSRVPLILVYELIESARTPSRTSLYPIGAQRGARQAQYHDGNKSPTRAPGNQPVPHRCPARRPASTVSRRELTARRGSRTAAGDFPPVIFASRSLPLVAL